MSSRSFASRLKGVFPGWWMVLSGGIQFGWAQGASQLGIFMKPFQAEFGWSRAQISVAASLQRLQGGLESMPEGLAIDKWGPRAVHLIGLSMFGLALMGMYFVDSLWMFYVMWLLVATGHNGGYLGCLDKAVADWFARRRGLMLSVMRSINSGLASPTLMLVSWLLYTYGWREAFLVAGAVTLVTGLPLTWFIIKPRRPEYYGWLPDGKRVEESVAGDTEATIARGAAYAAETTGEVEFTLRQAMRGRTFWIYLVFFTFRSLAQPVVGLHLVPYLTDIGLDPVVAAGLLGARVFSEIPGRLFFGWMADTISLTRMKYLAMVVQAIEVVGVIVLMQADQMQAGSLLAMVWIFVIIHGIGGGASIAIIAPMRARFWGRKAYASVTGAMQTMAAVGGIAAPIYAGWIYDTYGSYQLAFLIMIGTLVLATVLAFLLNPPKPPEKIGKVTEFI